MVRLKARRISDEARIVQDASGQRFIIKPQKRKKDDGTMNAKFGF